MTKLFLLTHAYVFCFAEQSHIHLHTFHMEKSPFHIDAYHVFSDPLRQIYF